LKSPFSKGGFRGILQAVKMLKAAKNPLHLPFKKGEGRYTEGKWNTSE
jgi:hypothetical protein